MLAPQASNNFVVSCFSSSVIGSAGSGSNADAPPEIRHSTRSSAPAAGGHFGDAPRAFDAALVGHGMAAFIQFDAAQFDPVGDVWPYFTFSRPPVMRRPSTRSAARAMAAPALPAPIT